MYIMNYKQVGKAEELTYIIQSLYSKLIYFNLPWRIITHYCEILITRMTNIIQIESLGCLS